MAIIERYTGAAIWLHWIIAALIVINTALGLSADHWPDAWVRTAVDTHKSIGITVLGLVIMRILWRATHRPPALPSSYARWERAVSHIAHLALYLLIVAVPLSGWLHDSAWKGAATHPMFLFGLVPWPRIGFLQNLPPDMKDTLHDALGLVHFRLGYALDALVALHIVGALKHQFLDREPELQRMWPAARE